MGVYMTYRVLVPQLDLRTMDDRLARAGGAHARVRPAHRAETSTRRRRRPPPAPTWYRWLVALAVAVLGGDVAADSTLAVGAGGSGSATARLTFKVVIPSILWVDTATGTVYSNDRKFTVRLGIVDGGLLADHQARGEVATGVRTAGCNLAVASAQPHFAIGRDLRRPADVTVAAAGLYSLPRVEAGCVLAAP